MVTGICGGRSANKNKKKNDLRRENVGGPKGKGPKVRANSRPIPSFWPSKKNCRLLCTPPFHHHLIPDSPQKIWPPCLSHKFCYPKMVVPDVFANCPGEYRDPADQKYLTCAIEPGQVWCTMLKELHRAKEFRQFFLAFLPLAIAIIALVANSLLAILSIRLLFRKAFIGGGLSQNQKQEKNGRKRLVLLLSRSMACLLALFLLLFVLLAWRFGAFNYWSLVIFMVVGVAQFLAMAGTNLALSSMLYAAVLHPLLYRSRISMGFCWVLIATIWAIAIGASIPFALLGATLFYPQSAPINCPFDDCQWPISLCLFLLLTIAYFLTISFHLAMLWQMHRKTRRIQPRSQSKGSMENAFMERHFRAMNRLSLNLLVFSLCKVPFVLISLIGLIKLEGLRQLGLGHKSHCKTFLHGQLFFQVELLSSLAAVVWLIGMVLDPAIDLCLDSRFQNSLQPFFGPIKSFLKCPRKQQIIDDELNK